MLPRASRLRRLLPAVPVLLGLLGTAPFCFRPVTETDAGWHLALGRVISTQGIPATNVLTWTAPDERWYPTSWLYDWLAFQLTARFGIPGLQLLTFALVSLTLVGAALACVRVDGRRGVWLVPLIALMITPRITERPHLASWVLLVFVLWLCLPAEGAPADFRERARRDPSWRRRLACVPLIALCSNFHSGAVFPAAVLACFCAEALLGGSPRKRELGIALAGFGALLANPGGLFNLEYLLQNLHVRDVIDVVEMGTPTPRLFPVFYIALPLGLFAAWQERRRTPALLATVVLFAVFGIRAARFVYELEMVAVISVIQWLRPRRLRWSVGFTLAATGLLLASRLPAYRALRSGSDFDASQLPVRAARFVRAERVSGPMYNAFRDGGYLEWALPEQRWFQDGRVQAFPPAFFVREQQVEQSAEQLRGWLRERGVEWAVASRRPERMAAYTQLEAPDWALVYWDETSEVRLRRDVPRFAALIAAFEYKHFRPNEPVTVGTADRAELVEWDRELARFEETTPAFPAALTIHCAVRARLGSASLSICDQAAAHADSADLRARISQLRHLPAAP